mmetsp:Transcript_36064/g.112081  ORF Transcript_36064/g.112081 Transcript_36064/m.112081 type:complete len:138 (+) Transcript_36064:414-827(+)
MEGRGGGVPPAPAGMAAGAHTATASPLALSEASAAPAARGGAGHAAASGARGFAGAAAAAAGAPAEGLSAEGKDCDLAAWDLLTRSVLSGAASIEGKVPGAKTEAADRLALEAQRPMAPRCGRMEGGRESTLRSAGA